jgi:glucose/arabinose dehydrogenase/putative cell wall-binding protein
MRRGPLAAALVVLALVPVPTAAAAPTVVRYSGPDRFATAAAVSAARFTAPSPVVHIASGSTFADALAAGPVAGTAGGPVLLVPRDSIPASVDQELRRLRPSRLVVAGGPAAVSGLVEAQLHQYTPGSVDRIAGADRFSTAAALSASGFGPGSAMAFVTTGAGFADALAASAAGVNRGPVLLTTRDALPDVTASELRRLRPGSIAVVGGPAAVGDAVLAQLRPLSASGRVDRLAGPDRFATAAAVSAVFSQSQTDEVFVATGRDFPDALSAGAAAGRALAPLLLAEPNCMPAPTRRETVRIDPSRLVLLGGTAALGDQVGTLAECGSPPVGLNTLATGLEAPWDVAFVPGGAAYITERDSGRLLRRDPNGTVTEVQRFVVDPAGEGGLLGLTPSPDFARDGLLYVFLTSASDNRIIRFRPGEPGTPILTGLPKATVHDAGRIAFGPDGMLYAATGDAGTPSRSQDPASNAGKILRLRPDGGVPADNPRQGSLVYALGFRDPQGIAWDSAGRLYATEFGPDRDDEVNVVVPNGNYGWPTVTGVARDPRFVDPIVVRQPAVASWSGDAVLKGGAIPQWEGDLFVAALRGQRLYRFDLTADGTVAGAEELFIGQLGRLRHVEQAPDGSLWILTSNRDGRGSPGPEDDRILRLGT